jgi:hypothetical protein
MPARIRSTTPCPTCHTLATPRKRASGSGGRTEVARALSRGPGWSGASEMATGVVVGSAVILAPGRRRRLAPRRSRRSASRSTTSAHQSSPDHIGRPRTLTSDFTTRPPIPCGFEPVSAETQPVSGRPPIQISDIEKSSSRDSPRDSRLFVRFLENSWRETGSLPSNPRKGRHFRQYPKFPARDACGWLGCQDSNRDVSNSSRSLQSVGADRIVSARNRICAGLVSAAAASFVISGGSRHDPFGPKPATR